MAESTLTITRSEIKRAIGRLLGINPDPSGWLPDEKTAIADAIKVGERAFYNPQSHSWSFMRPRFDDLVLQTGVGDYDLPDAFGGLVGTLSFPAGDSAFLKPFRQVGVARLNILRGQTALDYTAQPEWFAIHPRPFDGETEGQRWTLSVHSLPDREYTLVGQYFLNPSATSDDAPYPMGGQAHSETLREACLAAAEVEINGLIGEHTALFEKRMAASIEIDRRVSTPRSFGYNADLSDHRGPYERHRVGRVLYNGVAYDGGD